LSTWNSSQEASSSYRDGDETSAARLSTRLDNTTSASIHRDMRKHAINSVRSASLGSFRSKPNAKFASKRFGRQTPQTNGKKKKKKSKKKNGGKKGKKHDNCLQAYSPDGKKDGRKDGKKDGKKAGSCEEVFMVDSKKMRKSNQARNGFGQEDFYYVVKKQYEVGFYTSGITGEDRYYYYYKPRFLDLNVLGQILSDILRFKLTKWTQNSELCTYGTVGDVVVTLTPTRYFGVPKCPAVYRKFGAN